MFLPVYVYILDLVGSAIIMVVLYRCDVNHGVINHDEIYFLFRLYF